jgi:hypothetical protein
VGLLLAFIREESLSMGLKWANDMLVALERDVVPLGRVCSSTLSALP